jgi:hypothetical protein
MMVLIKRDLAEFHPLDADDRDLLPRVWTGDHVGMRLTEALQTLRMLPGGGGGSTSVWPPYLYEFEDLLAQQRQGELERTMKIQNRTRLSPSLNEISRMEVVLLWPMQYLLKHSAHLLEPVMWLSHAYSMERDASWVVHRRGGFIDTWQARYAQGCTVIADGLIAEKVTVF